MLNFRRPFVWLPLVVLTAYFAGWGQRNRRLMNNREDVWLEIPAYYLNTQDGIYSGQHLFAANQTTKLTLCPGGSYDMWMPPSSALIEKFRQRYPQIYLEQASIPPVLPINSRDVELTRVEFDNEFSATCKIYFSTGSKSERHYILHLTRSTLNIWNDDWHVVKADPYQPPLMPST